MVGKILLGILALLVLLLVFPATAYVRYNQGEFTVKLRVLFVVIRVFPLKEKKQKPKKTKKKKERKWQAGQDETPEEEKPKRTLEQQIRLIKRLATSAGGGAKFILRHLFFRNVRLVLPVHADDAAATAIRVGQMQALVGGTRAVLANLAHIKYKQLEIVPDFTGQLEVEPYFACNILASPVIMVIAAGIFMKRFLTYGRRPRRKRKWLSRAQRARLQASRAAKKAG